MQFVATSTYCSFSTKRAILAPARLWGGPSLLNLNFHSRSKASLTQLLHEVFSRVHESAEDDAVVTASLMSCFNSLIMPWSLTSFGPRNNLESLDRHLLLSPLAQPVRHPPHSSSSHLLVQAPPHESTSSSSNNVSAELFEGFLGLLSQCNAVAQSGDGSCRRSAQATKMSTRPIHRSRALPLSGQTIHVIPKFQDVIKKAAESLVRMQGQVSRFERWKARKEAQESGGCRLSLRAQGAVPA